MDMQGKLLIIAGLPGAGKTTYLKQLLRDDVIDWYYDDFQDRSYQKSPSPRHSRFFGSLAKHLKHHKRIAVADIRYCIPRHVYELVEAIQTSVPDIRIRVRYFENNPEACILNVKARAMKEGSRDAAYELQLIDYYSAHFQLLPEFVTLPALSVRIAGASN